MLLGYFDCWVLGVLSLLNILFWKKRISEKFGCFLGVALFGIVLPLISQGFEIKRVQTTIGIIDNFEVLYTYFRFPVYWAIGIIQAFVLRFKNGYQ